MASIAASPMRREAGQAAPSALARSGSVLGTLQQPIHWLDRAAGRALPDALNPLVHAGPVANFALLVAIATGLLLLFWYDVSVHGAHASLAEMQRHRFGSGFVRSLHRVSSDAAMFFVLVHALRTFLARHFGGARWLAWVTGLALALVTWVVGWTGYWLAWDERARQVALGSAKLIDALPIFIDPLARSFLTDGSVNSLLFFLVFFLHVLLPLPMALAFALHVLRLSRPKMLPGRTLAWASLGGMALLSIALPADLAAPARMLHDPAGFPMDWWYLAPLALTDRLGAGALWGVFLVGFLALVTLPWTLGRERTPREPARVEPPLCNGCTKCSVDCPYDAISMVARDDEHGRSGLGLARVDPAKCTACGICAGSCDSAGVGVPWLPVVAERRRVDRWIEEAIGDGERPFVLLGCAESAADGVASDAGTGRCEALPGWRALKVPCAGWIHPLTVERVLRRGARGVVVATCSEGTCPAREGATWTRERLEGAREPALRADKVDPAKVTLVQLPRGATRELLGRLRDVERGGASRAGAPDEAARAPGWARAGVIALGTLALLAVVGGVSVAPYSAPVREQAELVVSFAHPGALEENCRDLTAEEIAALPPHMRTTRQCDRRRAPVRVRVTVDGEEIFRAAHAPKGAWGDAESIALDALVLAPGRHVVVVQLGETSNPDEWTHAGARTVDLPPGGRCVVLFDRGAGFSWHT